MHISQQQLNLTSCQGMHYFTQSENCSINAILPYMVVALAQFIQALQ